MVVTRRHRHGTAHDRLGRVSRHRRPAVGSARPPHLDRRSPMGRQRLHPCLRQSAAFGREDCRLPGTSPRLCRRSHRLWRCLRPRWPRAECRHALRRPGTARRIRSDHGTGCALASHDDVHGASRKGEGLRRLRRHRRRWGRDRSRSRRDAHAVGLLALGPAHQRAHRDLDRRRRDTSRPREQGARALRLRHPRCGGGDERTFPSRLRLHCRRYPWLGSPSHDRAPGGRRSRSREFCGHRAPFSPRTVAHAGPPRPQPGWSLPGLAAGGQRAVGDVPVPHLLLARDAGLLGP